MGIATILVGLGAKAETLATAPTAFVSPPPPPSTSPAKPVSLSSPACQVFQDQIQPKLGDGASKTDQFVVYHGGQKVFDWNDGVVKKESPHETWSVSKTVTATLIGTAVQEGKIKLDDPIAGYFPELIGDKRVDHEMFDKIKIRDLMAMTSGFQWTESALKSTKEQSDLPFLFSAGYPDLVKYISHLAFASEPGQKWNYSSVNAVLEMAIIRKVYGTDANDMPWNNLFRQLDLKSARFEKDRSGTYIGSAYVHLSAEDLAKIGQLYLNDGVWNGKRLLPEGWVDSVSRKQVPQSSSTAKQRSDFGDLGPYSAGSFWLNKPVKGVGKPFPHLPDSAYFASGLFGQALIVLPDQNMVITRTGHNDPGVDPHYDEIVGNAMKCFAASEPGTPRGAPLQVANGPLQLPDPTKAIEEITDLNYILDQGILSGMLAKELCSCHFVENMSVSECLNRSPIPTVAANLLSDINTDDKSKIITLNPRLTNAPAQARFNTQTPREGCKLTYGYADMRRSVGH